MVGEDPKMIKFKVFIADFLESNKELQGKFHETWAYKKVLHLIKHFLSFAIVSQKNTFLSQNFSV